MDIVKTSLILLFVSMSLSQDFDSTLTLEKKSLMILPPEQNEHKEFAEDILSILSQQATDLGRYDVIDRNLVDEILEEQKFQYSGNVKESDIVELGEMVAAEEALILEIVHFGQKGVPPEKDKDKNDKDETLFGWVVKKTVSAALYDSEKEKARRKEELDNNIQTVVNANVKLVNVETGQTHDSFNLNAEYTGGNIHGSRKRVLTLVTHQSKRKLRGLYTLTSEVVKVKGKTVSILNGKNLGLKKGDFFEINSKDKVKTYNGKEISYPGKTRGLLKITHVGPDVSEGTIIRKWRKIKKGNRALEMLGNPSVVDFGFGYIESSRFDLSVRGWINPTNTFSGSVNIKLGGLKDSRDDMDFYFGFGTTLDYTLLSGFGTQVSTSLEIPFNFVHRSDDDGHIVSGLVFMPAIELNTSIQIAHNLDILLTVNQLLSVNDPNWQYRVVTGVDDEGNDEVEWESAVWNSDKPTLDIEGSLFSISIRRHIF